MRTECLRSLGVASRAAASDDRDERPQTVVDGTLGGGGHAAAWLPRLPRGSTLIGIDRDPAAITRSRGRLEPIADEHGQTLITAAASYAALPTVLDRETIDDVDAILLDLGLSSDQLLDRDRGFGFQAGGAFDLRFDPGDGPPASEWLRSQPVDAVADVLTRFGDQPQPRAVAEALKQAPVDTTEEFVRRVESVVGRGGPNKHAATRASQAIRIAVNDELSHVDRALREVFPSCLRPGGTLAVMTFHSIEDRLVKRALNEATDAAGKPVWTLTPKKPILPRPAEVRENPRSRSAKLRVARRNTQPHDSWRQP